MMSELGEQALLFSQWYVALVDSLRAQGVPEDTARAEARMAAVVLMYQSQEVEGVEGETCPLCGHVRDEED